MSRARPAELHRIAASVCSGRAYRLSPCCRRQTRCTGQAAQRKRAYRLVTHLGVSVCLLMPSRVLRTAVETSTYSDRNLDYSPATAYNLFTPLQYSNTQCAGVQYILQYSLAIICPDVLFYNRS